MLSPKGLRIDFDALAQFYPLSQVAHETKGKYSTSTSCRDENQALLCSQQFIKPNLPRRFYKRQSAHQIVCLFSELKAV